MPDLRFRYECPLAWDDLSGDDRARFCSSCQTTVTNLSALSAAETEAFLRSRQGRVCVRVEHDRAGRIRHWPDLRAAALAAALAACAPGDDSGLETGTPAADAGAAGRVEGARGHAAGDAAEGERHGSASDSGAAAASKRTNRLADAPTRNAHTVHLERLGDQNAASDHPEWLQVLGYVD